MQGLGIFSESFKEKEGRRGDKFQSFRYRWQFAKLKAFNKKER